MNKTKLKENYIKILSGVLILSGVIIAVSLLFIKHTGFSKGGEDNGMFEKNSDKISLYKNGVWIKDFKGQEKDEIVERLKKYEWNNSDNDSITMDESYNIMFDFNNTFCKLYLREEDKSCFLNKNQFILADQLYDFLMTCVNN